MSRRLRRLLARGLSPNPSARYPSLSELLEDLRFEPAERIKRWAPLAVAAITILGGGLAYKRAEGAKARVCQTGPDRLRGAWDDERRASLLGAFDGTRLPYAKESAAAVVRALDARGAIEVVDEVTTEQDDADPVQESQATFDGHAKGPGNGKDKEPEEESRDAAEERTTPAFEAVGQNGTDETEDGRHPARDH